MRNVALWALVVVNALLAVAWVMRSTAPNAAMAQAARPGDYVMIPGQVIGGGGSSVVYLVDTTNGTLSAVSYDGRENLAVMPPIDLTRLFEGNAR